MPESGKLVMAYRYSPPRGYRRSPFAGLMVLQSRAAVASVVVGIAASAEMKGLGFAEHPVPVGKKGESSSGAEGEREPRIGRRRGISEGRSWRCVGGGGLVRCVDGPGLLGALDLALQARVNLPRRTGQDRQQ
jgi:hypothetical protein